MSNKLTLAAISIAALLAASPALAVSLYSVPTGCTAPTGTYAHTYYVDPIKGSDTGDGSATKPWKTLSTVVNAGLIATQPYKLPYVPGSSLQPAAKTGIVKPGDLILLLSGDHGVVNLKNAFNTSFITIKAAPRATPIVSQLAINGASYWIFDGVTFESINNTTSPGSYTLATIRSNTYFGPLNNIIINGNTFKSQADVSGWTPIDWRNKSSNAIFFNAGMALSGGATDYRGVNNGKCITVTHNAISNIAFGIVAQLSDQVLVAYNTIDHFADDGIDYGSSDLVIDHNVITNSVDDGDGMHRDGMQGQPYWGETTYNHDVTISNNTVIAQTGTTYKYPACMQGIDAFDGLWDNVKVYNNVVISNAYHGISYYGVNNGQIVNNTVLAAGDPTKCFLQPGAVAGSGAASAGPNTDALKTGGGLWIGVFNAKSGTPSKNVVVLNNIANNYVVNAVGVTFNHNVIAGTNTKLWMPLPTGGVAPIFGNPDAEFVKFDPATYKYDLHLAANSIAIGAGTTLDAPVSDINGVARKAPIDAGAYAHLNQSTINPVTPATLTPTASNAGATGTTTTAPVAGAANVK